MGILILGVGLGGAATFGALLHAVNHSLAKAMLFLVAGNILTVYQSKAADDVRGVLRVLPASGILWVAGFFAITGSPPFGPFLSELTILKAVLDAGRTGVAAIYLVLLAVIFVGMIGAGLRMAQGPAEGRWALARPPESVLAVGPPAALAAAVLILGVYVPPLLRAAIEEAAHLLG
jgi:hydrogenase-4 component F